VNRTDYRTFRHTHLSSLLQTLLRSCLWIQTLSQHNRIVYSTSRRPRYTRVQISTYI